jgi:hypothetical protein
VLALRVAVAKYQQVHFHCRVAIVEYCDHPVGIGGRLAMHHVVVRVDRQAPDFIEPVRRIAFLQDEFELVGLCREPHGLVVGAIHVSRLARRFPFAVDAAETPRPGDGAGAGIDDFEQVFAPQCFVDRAVHVAGPWQRLEHDLVQTEYLHLVISGMIEVDTHGGGRFCQRGGGRE